MNRDGNEAEIGTGPRVWKSSAHARRLNMGNFQKKSPLIGKGGSCFCMVKTIGYWTSSRKVRLFIVDPSEFLAFFYIEILTFVNYDWKVILISLVLTSGTFCIWIFSLVKGLEESHPSTWASLRSSLAGVLNEKDMSRNGIGLKTLQYLCLTQNLFPLIFFQNPYVMNKQIVDFLFCYDAFRICLMTNGGQLLLVERNKRLCVPRICIINSNQHHLCQISTQNERKKKCYLK